MMTSFEHARLELFRNAGFHAESRRLDDASRTYALTNGEVAGTCPTLLIHGGMAEASVWYRLAPYLDGPVVIVDRPAHGLTSDMNYRGVDYEQHAVSWLHGVINALGVARVHLVGNSMGGYFSTVYALAHPARVCSLVLAGAPAGSDRELPRFIHMWRRPIIGSLLGMAMIGMKDPQKIRERGFRSLCTHPEYISDAALHVARLAMLRPRWNAMMRSMIATCSDGNGWRESLSIRERMTTLRVPTLFAWGDSDSFAPPSSGEAIAARMRDARVEVLVDAGHLPHLDQPEALARSIATFQRGLRSSSSAA